jgi:hypothetical protein
MATKASLNATQRQKLVEGLKELASMIATAYRRRVTGETDTEPLSSTNYDQSLCIEEKTVQYAYPEDRRHEGEYTETVKVESFLRRKAHQVRKSRTHEVVEVSE